MPIDTPKLLAVIFAARGAASVPVSLRRKLASRYRCRWITCLKGLSPSQFGHHAGHADYVALTRRLTLDFDRRYFDCAPRLKGLSLYATGYEWVDMDVARARRVKVSYLPSYATNAVAEHALAMALVLHHRIHLSDRRSRSALKPGVSLRGRDLTGTTAGIVGYGRIGRRLERMLKGLGCRVLNTDRRRGAGNAPLSKVLKESGTLFLCSSIRRGEKSFLNRSRIRALRRASYVVNVSRPALVDHSAMLAALRSKAVAGYGLDEVSEDLASAKGLDEGRVLMTHHTAWYTDEAMRAGTRDWMTNLYRMAARPANLVTR